MTVSVERLKAHLNITESTDDNLLTGKLAAATSYVAAIVGSPVTDALLDEAILKLAAHFYETRELTGFDGASAGIPADIHDLLAPARAWAF